MKTITVTTDLNDTVKCVSFFDVDLGHDGIDLYMDGNRLGSLIGYDIPDENDKDQVNLFTTVIEEWLVENDN